MLHLSNGSSCLHCHGSPTTICGSHISRVVSRFLTLREVFCHYLHLQWPLFHDLIIATGPFRRHQPPRFSLPSRRLRRGSICVKHDVGTWRPHRSVCTFSSSTCFSAFCFHNVTIDFSSGLDTGIQRIRWYCSKRTA